MVSSCQIDTIGGGHLEEKKGKNDFDREGTAVDKVAIEEVGIVGTWVTIQLKDIEDAAKT